MIRLLRQLQASSTHSIRPYSLEPWVSFLSISIDFIKEIKHFSLLYFTMNEQYSFSPTRLKQRSCIRLKLSDSLATMIASIVGPIIMEWLLIVKHVTKSVITVLNSSAIECDGNDPSWSTRAIRATGARYWKTCQPGPGFRRMDLGYIIRLYYTMDNIIL